MEEPSLNGVESLPNSEDNIFHNPNNPSTKEVSRQSKALAGDEENAPENSVEDRKRNLPRFRVFKKMRLGLSPNKSNRRGGSIGGEATKSKMSATKLSSKIISSTLSGGKSRSVIPKKIQANPKDQKRLFSGRVVAKPSIIPAPAADQRHSNAPVPENIPSSDSSTEASSYVSGNSRNWLDDFGKQSKGNASMTESRQDPVSTMSVPGKDPRFHCKRKIQPQPRNHHAIENPNPASRRVPSDPDASQVFLAPVMVPPSSIINSRGRRPSPRHEAPQPQVDLKEPPSLISSPSQEHTSFLEQAPQREEVELQGPPRLISSPPQQRASVFEVDQAAIAAAQMRPSIFEQAPQREEAAPEPRRLLSSPPQQRASVHQADHAAISAAHTRSSVVEQPPRRETHPKPRRLHSLPPQMRVSEFQADNAAIAAAQEAPALAPSWSQESTETSSVAMSAVTTSSTSSMASSLVKRLRDPPKSSSKPRPRLQCAGRSASLRSTPIRIKPRVKSQEVQATDKGYASVAKLSAWLADDPTSTKKVRHVRRGANVISKSRKFEKDLEGVIVEEANISSGAVAEKKNWLKSAFVHEHEEEDQDEFLQHDPNRHMMMMRTRPVNDDDCARSEFVVDDSASVISVTNKKKWLENAFKKEGESVPMVSKAQSDIGPLRESRDEISSRAKKKWQQKSERRGAPNSAHKPPPAPSPYRHQGLPKGTPGKKSLEERMRAALGTRASLPSQHMAKAACAAAAQEDQPTSHHSIVGVPLDEDTTPVDFGAARQLLIQRSKANGNAVAVASKVQRRASKFERIAKDEKRRMSVTGLLKPTWESNVEIAASESEESGPSDAYTKSFAEDHAPKRSIDELP